MELRSLERDMLEGKHGQGVALATKSQVGTGRAFYAKRMVPETPEPVLVSRIIAVEAPLIDELDRAFHDEIADGDLIAVDAVAGKIVVREKSGAESGEAQ